MDAIRAYEKYFADARMSKWRPAWLNCIWSAMNTARRPLPPVLDRQEDDNSM